MRVVSPDWFPAAVTDKLLIIVNNIPEVEFDRTLPLESRQGESLGMMDEKMDAGITVGDQFIENPDIKQRAHFVAALLVHALRTENNASIAFMSAYIATRLPDVRQVRITEKDGGVEVDLNYSDVDANAVPIAMPGLLN